MAKAAAQTTETRETREESGDSPLLDSLGAAIKKVIAEGKEKGYVTYENLNAALPPDQVSGGRAANLGLVTAKLKTTLNNVVSSYAFDGSSGVSRCSHASFTHPGTSIK